MSVSVSRGSANFTLPDAVIAASTKVNPFEIKTMIDAIVVMHNEVCGVLAIVNDPVVPQSGGLINNGGSLNNPVPDSLKARRLPGFPSNLADIYNATKGFFTGGNQRLSINNINNFVGSYKSFEMASRYSNPSEIGSLPLAGINPQATESAAIATTINTVLNNLSVFNSYLQARNGWWSGDLCARSCQVSCQTSCQLACQGCNNNTCHNQNCGGWS